MWLPRRLLGVAVDDVLSYSGGMNIWLGFWGSGMSYITCSCSASCVKALRTRLPASRLGTVFFGGFRSKVVMSVAA